MASKTLEKIFDEFKERERIGELKYGCTVDDANLDKDKWLQHLKEELMDALVYIAKFSEKEAE